MAKSRIKSDKQIKPIADWQQADKLVKQIGDLLLKITSHETYAKNVIDEAKDALAEKVKPLQSEIELLKLSLEAFAANNTEDFGKAQSRKLNFGLLGWRRSSEIKTKNTTLELIKKVFGKKAEQYLHIKETVNKEALEALKDGELASVDARRKPKEVFFVEPDLPKAIDL